MDIRIGMKRAYEVFVEPSVDAVRDLVGFVERGGQPEELGTVSLQNEVRIDEIGTINIEQTGEEQL